MEPDLPSSLNKSRASTQVTEITIACNNILNELKPDIHQPCLLDLVTVIHKKRNTSLSTLYKSHLNILLNT